MTRTFKTFILLCLLLLGAIGGAGAQTLLKTLTWTGPVAANATAGSTALGANQVDVQGGVASVNSSNQLVLTSEGSYSFYRDDLFFSDVAACTTGKFVMNPTVSAAFNVSCKLMYQPVTRDGYNVVVAGPSGGNPAQVTLYKITGTPANSYVTFINNIAWTTAYVTGHNYQIVAQAVGTPGSSTIITISVFDLTANPGDPTTVSAANPVATATYTDTSSPFTSGQFALATLNGSTYTQVRLYSSGTVASLALTSPSPFQVFQRSGTSASIRVSGKNQDAATHSIEASFNGGAYQTVATSIAANATFSGTITGQAQGQGTLTARFVDTPATTATAINVGIGDVWVIAGQSNSSGRGTNNQIFLNGQGVVGGLFGNDYTWKALADPTDDVTGQVDSVSNDSNGQPAGTNAGGSVWPLVASQFTGNLGIPVAFIACASGGTSITQWQPGASHTDRTTLYGSMIYRAQLCGGAKGVLWWQGETDSVNNMTQSAYVSNMTALAAAVKTDLGCKLIPCKLQNFGGGAAEAIINAAIAQEWATDPNVLPGADLTNMVTDAGYHFYNDGNILTASSRWWNAIYKDFYAATSSGTKRRIQ